MTGPLLLLHLQVLQDHRFLPPGDHHLPIYDPAHFLALDITLLLQLGPLLCGAGSHRLDAVPQTMLLVGEPLAFYL
jgi:hypothetical protein